MKNLILIAIALFVGSPFAFAQLTIQAPNGDVGVGTDTPEAKLDIDGVLRIDPNHTNTTYGEFVNTTANLNINKIRTTGSALIDMNPQPLDGTSNARFRFFRQSNTTGGVSFDVHHGDGTSAVNSRLSANGDSFLNKDFGNVAIGVGAGTGEKLYVSGDIFATGIITPSDRNLKNKVKKYNEGLEIINQLQPVSYKYNGKASLNTERTHIGLIAQELQEIAPNLVDNFDFPILDAEAKRIGTEHYLKIHDSEIKYILINAIKEQTVIIENQEDEIKALQNDVEYLKTTLEALLSSSQNNIEVPVQISTSKIEQNIPNPFNGNTQINYEAAKNGVIEIYSIDGKSIKRVDVQAGKGTINLSNANLPAGTYTYNLIVEGKLIDTKQMVISN